MSGVEVLTDSSGWDECPHGLPQMTCSSCRHPYKPPEKPTVEYIFRSKFGGHCYGCNLPILVGDSLARMSDDTYQHAECAR